MTVPSEKLKPFVQFQRLVWLQRSVRLIIRAVWFGLGSWLVAWSCCIFWGWPPSRLAWLVCAGGVFLTTLAFIPSRKPPLRSLTWTVDRRFNLKEQSSTAYMVVESGDSNPVHSALVEDVQRLLPPIIQNVQKKGWRLLPDALSLLVVLGLFLSVYQAEYIQPEIVLYQPGQNRIQLPPLGEDPRMSDLVKSQNIDPKSEEEDKEQPEAGQEGQTEGSSNSLAEWQNPEGTLSGVEYKSILQKMEFFGGQLTQDADMYDISQGMMSGNLEQTADAIEKLADQLDKMSVQTRQQIEDLLRETANQLSAEGLSQSSEVVKQAADALEQARLLGDITKSADIIMAKESLDQIAAVLRGMSNELKQQQAIANTEGEGGLTARNETGTVVTSQDQGKPQEYSRLAGEGETLQFDPGNQLGLSSSVPASDQETATDQQSGTSLSASKLSTEFYINYIVPYFYPWKWHHVVSKYFQRD